MTQNGEAKANALSEDFTVALIVEYFGDIAAIDEKTVRENVRLACENGLSEEDRSLRVELMEYLLNEFSVIYLGLLANGDFRDSFKEAVSKEMEITGKSRDYILDYRRQFQEYTEVPSRGSTVIDLSTFDLAEAKYISGRIGSSMEKIKPFQEEFDAMVSEVTDADAVAIGYCICNFLYLIKAFNNNRSFEKYVKTVVRAVASGLGIA